MLRVLIVDDDELARLAIGDLLRTAGYLVFELPSPIGLAALAKRENVDAVILDVNMPAVTGDKVAKMLRQNAIFDRVATILISGRERRELADLAAKAQADGAVSKSVMSSELVPTVRRAIASCRNAPGPSEGSNR